MCSADRSLLFIFENTREFLRALKEVERLEMDHSVIAIPEGLSNRCGMSLKIAKTEATALAETLAQANISYTSSEVDD